MGSLHRSTRTHRRSGCSVVRAIRERQVGNSSVPSRAVDEEANDKGVSDPDLWHGRRQGQHLKLRWEEVFQLARPENEVVQTTGLEEGCSPLQEAREARGSDRINGVNKWSISFILKK